jgi:hypothetical protein
MNSLRKIVSGGQTGVDRAALDLAIQLRIDHGGWCPAGRLAEDGPIPARYHLQELASPNYLDRTRRNVLDSDGTLVICPRAPSGGTLQTIRMAIQARKPFWVIQCNRRITWKWLAKSIQEHSIEILNVAGPRASRWDDGYSKSQQVLARLLQEIDPSRWTQPPADGG